MSMGTFLILQDGSDGLLFKNPMKNYSSAQLPLNISNGYNVGVLISLLTGHCNLQLHLYKLKLTFSPTCICLTEDESPYHFIFSCPLYSNLRKKVQPKLENYHSLLMFVKQSNRFNSGITTAEVLGNTT